VAPDRAFTITEGDQTLAEIPLKTFRFATRPVPAGAAGK